MLLLQFNKIRKSKKKITKSGDIYNQIFKKKKTKYKQHSAKEYNCIMELKGKDKFQ